MANRIAPLRTDDCVNEQLFPERLHRTHHSNESNVNRRLATALGSPPLPRSGSSSQTVKVSSRLSSRLLMLVRWVRVHFGPGLFESAFPWQQQRWCVTRGTAVKENRETPFCSDVTKSTQRFRSWPQWQHQEWLLHWFYWFYTFFSHHFVWSCPQHLQVSLHFSVLSRGLL